ncbi:MAG: SCP2 sterol-binding domain-containing protein [Spirochaetes bacterium]|nr:SCP2 sterol-binding domain-containing protein [Spirochaetota bacterium]
MSTEKLRAQLNLYAVLQNLEELVVFDEEIKDFVKDWDISIQFSVIGGPKAYIEFKDGKCLVKRGVKRFASIVMLFVSPRHLNRMFDGKAMPILLRGFTKLGFLLKEFSVITNKLSYYLKPTPELLEDSKYLELNTRFTINTAAHAARELALYDTIGRLVCANIGSGDVQLVVQPNGPAAFVSFSENGVEAHKGITPRPVAILAMKGFKAANDFLNGKVDAFTAIVKGDVEIKGLTFMLDKLSVVLDRIPQYLS